MGRGAAVGAQTRWWPGSTDNELHAAFHAQRALQAKWEDPSSVSLQICSGVSTRKAKKLVLEDDQGFKTLVRCPLWAASV